MSEEVRQPLPPFTASRASVLDSRRQDVLTCATRLGDEAAEREFALRVSASLNLVGSLATMTDTECDFSDGYELRAQARATLQGRELVGKITYSSEEEERAVQALRARYDPSNRFAKGTAVSVKPREIVRLVAEALGMRQAGA